MKHMRYWLSSKRRQMAKLHDLQRQLQEAWDESASLDRAYDIVCEQVRREESDHKYTTAQLHRVARERDKERELRLAAEDRLLTDGTPYHKLIYAVETKYPNETRHETALRYIEERENQEGRAANAELEQAAEELRDVYLEQLANEEE